jgi:hypothetical protein
MSWPRRSCCSIGSRERCGACWRRPRPRVVARWRIGVGKFAVADRFGLDVFLADDFRRRAHRRDAVLKIRDVEKARFLEPDIDKRRLHPGQHARDLALVDIAGETDLPIALQEELGELIVFEHRHPHLQCGGVNCDFSFHRWNLSSGSFATILFGIAMRRESSYARRERRGNHSRAVVHRFTLCVDNLTWIIRGMPDVRKQA